MNTSTGRAFAPFAIAGALLWAPPAGAAPDAPPTYAVIDRIHLPGAQGWDYLEADPAGHRLFVTRGDSVMVVDTRDGSLLTTLPGVQGAHGAVPVGDFAYVTSGRNNVVLVYDLRTGALVDTVPVQGEGPDALVAEPTVGKVFVMNHRSGNIAVIDTAVRRVTATIPALGQLEFAVRDGHGRIFVNSEETGEIAVIDAASAKMVARWSLGGCEEPTGLAIDAAHERLFSVCANERMAIVDSRTGAVVATLPIGKHPDGAAFDPGTGMAFSSNGEGTLTLVHEDDPAHFRVVANLPTQPGARTIAVDPATHRVYLTAASYGPRPEATAENPHPRPPVVPGSVVVLVVAPEPAAH